MTGDAIPVVWIAVPSDHARAFKALWQDLRLAEAIDPVHDLPEPVTIENFDGATLVQWVVDLKDVILPIVSAALTYIVTSRGEFEYEKGEEKIRFKNLKPSQLKDVLALLDRQPDQ